MKKQIEDYYNTSIKKLKANEMLNVFEAIFSRRSVRRFTGDVVPDELLVKMITAGCYAPSAHNRQPWEYMIVKDRNKLAAIKEFHPYAKMIENAGSCIIVCGDTDKENREGFIAEDCSAAIQNMLLMAHGLGLGSVWCALYPVDKLTEAMANILDIPSNIIPVGIVVVGYADEQKHLMLREADTKIHYEKWSR